MPGGYDGYQQLRLNTKADGTALTASTTATSILPAEGKLIIPAFTYGWAGKLLKVRAFGRCSNIVTTPGTLTLDIRFGGTIVANSGALALNIVAKTNVTWRLEWDLFTRGPIGTVAQLFHCGEWKSESSIGAGAGGGGVSLLPGTTPALGTAFDATAQQQIDMFATWSLNNANSIQCNYFEIVDCN